jgi:hypothetical protein
MDQSFSIRRSSLTTASGLRPVDNGGYRTLSCGKLRYVNAKNRGRLRKVTYRRAFPITRTPPPPYPDGGLPGTLTRGLHLPR